jgi:hypothetical protein
LLPFDLVDVTYLRRKFGKFSALVEEAALVLG